jgi:hypothetical protein
MAQETKATATEAPQSDEPAAPELAPSAPTSTAAAPPPAAPASPRPPADRLPARPGEAEKITFDDLILGMQADVVFRDFMLMGHRAQELEGKRVSITGYMHPSVESRTGNTEFVLLRVKECKFGPGGNADHLARAFLRKGTTIDFTTAAVKVEGTLKIQPFEGPDGNTWSIYRLEDAVIR